jgi:SSS family solute:Na+ symporter
MQGHTIHWIDTLLVFVSVLATIGVGLYFAKRQKSSDHYFSGGKNIPAWAIGLSIFATLISSVTFLAYPAASYKSNWILLVQGLMVPLVLVCIIWLVVPLYRKAIRLSAYEYFERRFGLGARVYSSLAFMLTHFSKMGTVLYLVCLVLNTLSGIPIMTLIVTIGLCIVFLTLVGGIEAVIWMDVIQGFMIIGGGLLCLGLLLFKPEAGPVATLQQAWDMGKIGFGPYDFNFTELTFWVMAINGAFYALQKYGTDQTIVQRYIVAKTDKDAKRASYIGVLTTVPVWLLFMLIGSLLYVFYHNGTAVLPEGMKSDEVFPFFMGTQLPVGVVGLVLSAIVAAAFSTLASDMNCLSAIGVEDYYQRLKPNCSDKQRLNMGRWLVGVSGIAMMAVASLYVVWQGEGVLGMVFELYAIFSAGIVGIFLLGLFSTRANKQGLYIGIGVTVLFTAYAMLTSTEFEVGGQERILLDLGDWNFTQHKYMLGVYSHLIVIVVGYLASFFFPKPALGEQLTLHSFLEARKV